MINRKIFRLLMAIVVILSFTSFMPKNDGWVNLLDNKLSKWEIYQSYRFKDSYKGQQPKDENGNLIEPIGYNKNEANVFSVTEENGEPVLS